MSNQKDKTGSSKSKLVGTLTVGLGIGSVLGLSGRKLVDTLCWQPSNLEGKDLKKQIAIIVKLKLAKANRDKMDKWLASVSRVFEHTLLALAKKYELKEKKNNPHKIVQHLFDRKYIGEELKSKLCDVVDQRNKGIHEDLTEEELRIYFKQFQDILPVLRERL